MALDYIHMNKDLIDSSINLEKAKREKNPTRHGNGECRVLLW
jgi:hypothetical protein